MTLTARLKRSSTLLFLLIFSGCAQWGYYAQSVRGQLDLLRREAPIGDVINEATTSPELKEKLALTLRIREFASRELALPQNNSYRRYADLQRPFVVWNVFAAPEFSTKPVQWCFVMAGCVSYRGYFSQSDAQAFAAADPKGFLGLYVDGALAATISLVTYGIGIGLGDCLNGSCNPTRSP